MPGLLAILAASYLLGSIPTALLAGKLKKGIDIREAGSGNMGATNAFRVLGWKTGLAVALLDLAKGAVAVLVLARLQFVPGAPPDPRLAFIAATSGAMLGHMLPVFAGFRGGKGVAVAAGAIVSAHPLVAPFCLVAFGLALTLSGFVALASASAALALPLGYLAVQSLSGRGTDPLILGFFALAAAAVLFVHRKRLALYFRGEAELFEKAMIFRRKKVRRD
jgi:glycerol-3-phosphate acyltransferase PlsY